MPARTPRFVPTDAERAAHVKKYPLPDWCKSNEKKIKHPRKSNSFIKSVDWKLLRERVLHYYGAICMCCGSTKSINIDHIKPKSKYPELAMEFNNLQVLCWTCNRNKNYRDETDYRP